MAWYWPDVHTLKRATISARAGACLCFCFAVIGGVLIVRHVYVRAAIGAELSFNEVLRFSVSNSMLLFGPVLFTVAGWRIWKFSRAWAVVVLVWCLIQSIRSLGILLFLPPPLLLIFVFITAVRGTFAYHWLCEAQARTARAAVASHP